MAKKAAPAVASSLRLEKPARAGEKSGHRPDATRQNSPRPSDGRGIKGEGDGGRLQRPLLDTRVVYCGDNLEQLAKLPDACVDLIYIDPPFNSNRNYGPCRTGQRWGSPREITPHATLPHRPHRISRGETKEKRAFEDRHENTRAYIDYLRPRCVQLARVLKQTGSFYYHCDWHASHYVKVMLN